MKNTSRFDLVQLRCAIAAGSIEIPQAIALAMEKPIDFPPINQALVPGDRVAIAVHENLPHAVSFVESIVDWILQQQLDDLRISVILPSGRQVQAESLIESLKQKHPEYLQADDPRCRVICHDPDNQQNLEYIAASDQAEPIYLHRDLVEADFVIPVYRWLEPQDPRGHDPYVVLPAFADRATMNRHAKSWFKQSGLIRNTPKTASESGWLAGIQFAIAALANQEGKIAMIASGTPLKVDRTCRETIATTGNTEAIENAAGFDLIVAQLVDDPQSPNWSDVASAAHSAERWLNPAGRIVVVATQIDEISPGIAALASDDPDEELQQSLLESNLKDAFAAAVLRGIQSRRSIYVQSKVDPEALESLGFASIRDPNELERLMQSVARVGVMEY